VTRRRAGIPVAEDERKNDMNRIRFAGPALALLAPLAVSAAEQSPVVSLAEGHIVLTAPAGWVRQEPRVRIIDAEFSVPAAEGDPSDGRITIMAAGGSVQQNLNRWVGQFAQTQRNQVDKLQIAGRELQRVDLVGTYKDQKTPFTPAVMRENYRMLGAIIPTDEHGNYFIKFYGPQATVTKHEEAFQKFLGSLQMK
jgi:hypothetical protein